jgi:hypothetical protein
MQKAILFKVKTGQWSAWNAWCTKIHTTLRDEALLTLAEEKVLQEMTFGFEINAERYVLGYVDGECLPAHMEREINQEHVRMKEECLERLSNADILYSLHVTPPTLGK